MATDMAHAVRTGDRPAIADRLRADAERATPVRMIARPTARFALRTATAENHDIVDAAFSRFALDVAGDYRAFLMAQAGAFLPVEAGLDNAGIADILPDWDARRRAEPLIADLRDLGAAPPPIVDPPQYDSAEAMLGAVYVLEGSRLGGRMLARSVPPELPRRFLAAGAPKLWQKLIEVIDKSLVSEAQLAVAIEAARAVFARFEAGARCRQEDAQR